jgi:hypothetical protein
MMPKKEIPMSRLVDRNPFTREELHAERVYIPGATCFWCGGIRHTTKSDTNWLYQFWIETDEGKKYLDKKLVCSRECRNIVKNLTFT